MVAEGEQASRLGKQPSLHLQNIQRLRKETERDIEKLEDALAQVEMQIEAEKLKAGIVDKIDRDAILEMAKKTFNKSPKEGIKYLMENDYFPDGGTEAEVANFLYSEGADGKGLLKAPIGEYLGEFKDFNLKVLTEFANLHEFSGTSYTDALRAYLWSFRLPGEAQKIDRMMEVFAARYCECNPGMFDHPDACFILSFATIMLNTTLHNPSVAKKQTMEEFINMNRGINNGGDLDKGLLVSVYESIHDTPFKIPDDEQGLGYMFMNPDKKGLMVMETKKGWSKRWVVITNRCLYFFKTIPKGDEAPKGILPLEGLVANNVTTSRRKSHKDTDFYMEVKNDGDSKLKSCATNKKGEVVEVKQNSYVFRVTSEQDLKEWIDCISANVNQSENAFADCYQKKLYSAIGQQARLSIEIEPEAE
eukprot:m.174173 g.174173  ORF g.174173 m.174173 type:complete len:419 (+) comp15404_c0_seq4:1224-2480(+)